MCLLETQIELINTSLHERLLSDTRFAGARICGLVTDAYRTDEERNIVSYPVLLSQPGEGEELSIDDRYPLQLYHRLLSRSYTPLCTAIGNRSNIITEKAELKVIISAQANAISLSSFALESLIVAALPDSIAPAVCTSMKIRRMSVTPTASTIDALQIYRAEYKGIAPSIPPHWILIAIRYTIESDYLKGCFTIADC